MRKYHEVLTEAKRDKQVGNHCVRFFEHDELSYFKSFLDDKTHQVFIPTGITRIFQYHGNNICVVDDLNKRFWLSHAGWFTRSTNEALAGYRQIFHLLGYTNMNKIPVYKYERPEI